MQADPIFPGAASATGMYESFYLRAVSPRAPLGVWIRYTVRKAAGRPPLGSLWCTVFDRERGAPFMHKITAPSPRTPGGAWIEIDGQATMGPNGAEGACGPARWSLRFRALDSELRHLRPTLLYRAPLPRTKLTSPAPLALFDGVVELPGREPIELSAWPGMIGHNWGREHAERWIWLHGCAFSEGPEAWLDVALGRVVLAGRTTPWVANGALSLDGRRHRLGGLGGARPSVTERADGCEVTVPGAGGVSVELHAGVPAGTAAGWRYADPAVGEHEVINCSIASLTVSVRGADGSEPVELASDHGGAYELGLRPAPRAGGAGADGVAIAPFPDG